MMVKKSGKMEKIKINYYQIIAGTGVLIIAFIRLFDIGTLNESMDNTFILLLFISLIIFFVPFANIKSLKAGGVEIEVFEKKVKNAIGGLELKQIENEQLLNTILKYGNEIEIIKGSRILWIDDTPNAILGERRILRALGLDIHTSNNRETTLNLIDRDTDFDLIISDIQWIKDPVSKSVFYGGIELIHELRDNFKNETIGSVKTIFYTSYSEQQIKTINAQTNFLSVANSSICYSIEELIVNVIESLKIISDKPLKVTSRKVAYYRNN
jgi:CheY-like chemotaxis protein